MLRPAARTALVAALGVERLLELRRSRRNRAGAAAVPQAAASTFPAMVAAHVCLFAVCLWPRRSRNVHPAIEVVALGGLATATGLRIWSIRSLGRSWNVTAHVDPATRVVTSGPYRWIRHPNYVAVALEFVCLPLAVGAVAEAAVLSLANAAVLVPRIREEERLLDALPGYSAAFSGVPRFVPMPGRRSVQIPASASQSRRFSAANPV